MILCKEREELSSSWQGSRVAARSPKHLDYTMRILQHTLRNSAVSGAVPLGLVTALKPCPRGTSMRYLSFSHRCCPVQLTAPVPPAPPK